MGPTTLPLLCGSNQHEDGLQIPSPNCAGQELVPGPAREFFCLEWFEHSRSGSVQLSWCEVLGVRVQQGRVPGCSTSLCSPPCQFSTDPAVGKEFLLWDPRIKISRRSLPCAQLMNQSVLTTRVQGSEGCFGDALPANPPFSGAAKALQSTFSEHTTK